VINGSFTLQIKNETRHVRVARVFDLLISEFFVIRPLNIHCGPENVTLFHFIMASITVDQFL